MTLVFTMNIHRIACPMTTFSLVITDLRKHWELDLSVR